jgi:hypothetical protein
MSEHKRGIIYSATGQKYLAEAINSAQSSLRLNSVPHLIFCSETPKCKIEGIEFMRFNSSGEPYLDKICNITETPFEQTIFLDTDTYVLSNLDDLFDLLKRFDIAVSHTPGYFKCQDVGQSEAFSDFNTGVIPFRRNAEVIHFLQSWCELYERWIKAPIFAPFAHDQPAFRRALWESPLLFYILSAEYNYRTIVPGRLVGCARIVHGRCMNYQAVAAHINRNIGPRIFERFPSDFGVLPAPTGRRQ